jgi:hypothetical protein
MGAHRCGEAQVCHAVAGTPPLTYIIPLLVVHLAQAAPHTGGNVVLNCAYLSHGQAKLCSHCTQVVRSHAGAAAPHGMQHMRQG